ncbi:Signal recognition particle receptor subunit beta isoform X2 [Aphelenchoides fujianensis]|nr:Signal recognition particle receptor subunit beta isoform X2 [Aphelenchoides fujianensis]
MDSTPPPSAHDEPPAPWVPEVPSFGLENVPLLVWSSLIVFAVALLTYFVFFGRKKRTNVLLVGLSDAGKTAIFTRFVSKGVDWELYKSLAENVVQVAGASGETLQLIDCDRIVAISFCC